MKPEKIEEKISLPEDVNAEIDKNMVKITGPKGTIKKCFLSKKVCIELADREIWLRAEKPTKREKALLNTFKAHIKNMIKGTREGFVYKLKICASHFPISASIIGSEFVVKNFLGERMPRKLKLKEGVNVKVEGDIVTVSSIDKELAGKTAADIERLTKRTGYDKRVFQDGIYLIKE